MLRKTIKPFLTFERRIFIIRVRVPQYITHYTRVISF